VSVLEAWALGLIVGKKYTGAI